MKLKICGMKHQENTLSISELQPDFLGFIFWKDSKRYCENVIQDIPSTIQKIGVFVDADYNEIVDKIISHQLDFIQLHGEETADFCLQLRNTKIKVIKAITIDSKFNFNELKKYKKLQEYYLYLKNKKENESKTNYCNHKRYFIFRNYCSDEFFHE